MSRRRSWPAPRSRAAPARMICGFAPMTARRGAPGRSFTSTRRSIDAPVVTASDFTATHNQNIAASSLFAMSDADGDAITSYQFWDSTSDPSSGHFVVGGVAQGTNVAIDVTAAQLASTTFQSGSGSDDLWVRAYDGTHWRTWKEFHVNAPIDQAPGCNCHQISRGQQYNPDVQRPAVLGDATPTTIAITSLPLLGFDGRCRERTLCRRRRRARHQPEHRCHGRPAGEHRPSRAARYRMISGSARLMGRNGATGRSFISWYRAVVHIRSDNGARRIFRRRWRVSACPAVRRWRRSRFGREPRIVSRRRRSRVCCATVTPFPMVTDLAGLSQKCFTIPLENQERFIYLH